MLANEEWATWAGDVGSVAGEFGADALYGTATGSLAAYFLRYAPDSDLIGDVDSFAMRQGISGASAPSAVLGHAIALGQPLSELLLQYLRLSSTPMARARTSRVRDFVVAYGGVISGKSLTNRAAFVARLRPSVENFAMKLAFERMLKRGDPPPGSPSLGAVIVKPVDDATDRFVTWLEARL